MYSGNDIKHLLDTQTLYKHVLDKQMLYICGLIMVCITIFFVIYGYILRKRERREKLRIRKTVNKFQHS